MKKNKLFSLILILLFLTGCSQDDNHLWLSASVAVSSEFPQYDYSELINKSKMLLESELYCGDSESNSESSQYKYPELIDERVVLLEGEFYDKIESNPIDADFSWEDNGSVNRIMRASSYYKAWLAEIDNSMAVLKEYLSEEDYDLICSSYEGWLQYVENSMSVEQSIFYIGSQYMEEGNKFAGFGMYYPRVMEITAMRARDYAIELKALEYSFTEDVEFVYRSNESD